MRAAVLTEPDRPLVIEDLTRGPIGPSQVWLRIDASGVCHSDLTIQREGMGGLSPVILGHEGAGTVLEVNESLNTHPEHVNGDPYGDGWLIRVRLNGDLSQGLLDEGGYQALTQGQTH